MTSDTAVGAGQSSRLMNFDVTSPARFMNALRGGKDNFAADRRAADDARAALKGLPEVIRQADLFQRRAALDVASSWPDMQYLDLSAGFFADPTGAAHRQHPKERSNEPLHRVVHEQQKGATFVYASRDPMVMTHARVLLTAPGVGHWQGEWHQPDALFRDTGLQRHLDFTRPVTVFLGMSVVLLDNPSAARLMGGLRAGLAAGSRVILTHLSDPSDSGELTALVKALAAHELTIYPRSETQIRGLLDDWDLAPGDLTLTHMWHAQPRDPDPLAVANPCIGAVAGLRTAAR